MSNYLPAIPVNAATPVTNPFSTALFGGFSPMVAGIQQFEYSGWRNEELSWHDNCYIHAGLNPFDECRVTGPDMIPFLSYNLTNGFKSFPVGSIRHGVIVNEHGTLMADGIVLRTAEDEVECTCMTSMLAYRASVQNFDVTVEDLQGKYFFYQLGGPRSLEVVEAACKEDLHDLGFLHHRMAKICGHDVRIQRIGMAGALAYEVHGLTPDAYEVYEKLLEAGKEFGITQLGRHAYWNTHTENGFPQAVIHYPYAYEQEEGMWKMLVDTNSLYLGFTATFSNLTGSIGPEKEPRFVNPFELGWERSVSFNHDFIGKEALQKIEAEGYRKVVTLEWNAEDICDVWRSGIDGSDEPYAPIEGPEDFDPPGTYEYRADKVLCGDKVVGLSAGRIHSWYYKRMLSMAFIEPEYAVEGTELAVLWGNPDQRQKKIRATVARYPYMDVDRNEDIDVMEKIPRRFA